MAVTPEQRRQAAAKIREKTLTPETETSPVLEEEQVEMSTSDPTVNPVLPLDEPDIEYIQTPDSRVYGLAFNQSDAQSLALETAPDGVDVSSITSGIASIPGLALKDSMSIEHRMELISMVTSYLGVVPRKAMNYVGRKLTCIGCVVAPITGNVRRIDESTGEVITESLTWYSPLFKLSEIDPETDEHIIVAGGGNQALQLARGLVATIGAGDWPRPMEIKFSQEERQGVDEFGRNVPRRMMRVLVKPLVKPMKGVK